MKVRKSLLYVMAALIWGAPGVPITVKGVCAYEIVPTSEIWWSLVLTLCVAVFFYFIFSKVVSQYTLRISMLPEQTSIWHTFPLRGWILILFMMGLGVAMKYIPYLPPQFTAIFYSGLGPMLIMAAARFLKSGFYTEKNKC